MNGMKKCSKCDGLKTLDEFHRRGRKHAHEQSAYQAWCKQCQRDATRSWKVRNADRAVQFQRREQAETLPGATNYRKEWTGPELEVALREDLTAIEAARMLGRTLIAVRAQRHRHRVDARTQVLAGVVRGEL